MLETVGIAPAHEEVCRALLGAPESTVTELAATVGRAEEELLASVHRLEDLGLLTRTADRPPRLVPARPDAAIDVLVAQRRMELERAQADARTLLQEMLLQTRHRPDNLLEVVVGKPAIAARFAQLLSRTTDELLVLDRPPFASDPGSTARGRCRRGLGRDTGEQAEQHGGHERYGQPGHGTSSQDHAMRLSSVSGTPQVFAVTDAGQVRSPPRIALRCENRQQPTPLPEADGPCGR